MCLLQPRTNSGPCTSLLSPFHLFNLKPSPDHCNIFGSQASLVESPSIWSLCGYTSTVLAETFCCCCVFNRHDAHLSHDCEVIDSHSHFIFFCFFRDRISCSRNWSWTHRVPKTDLSSWSSCLRQVLGSQEHTPSCLESRHPCHSGVCCATCSSASVLVKPGNPSSVSLHGNSPEYSFLHIWVGFENLTM